MYLEVGFERGEFLGLHRFGDSGIGCRFIQGAR
jgi:hypothetical protein